MIRADAAALFARADFFRTEQAKTARVQSPENTFLKYEPWLRLAVPALVGLFIAVLTTTVILLLLQAHDRAIADAMENLDFLATATSRDLNAAATGSGTNQDPGQALAQSLPGLNLAHGQRVLVSDGRGIVVAAYPPETHIGGALADRLGTGQPLVILAEKAGVLRINLADGTDALATVRTLKAPFGQIAFVHPMRAVLANWWDNALRTLAALLATIVVLCTVAVAYFWQAARARKADLSRDRIRDRIDTALNRGRCGLWDWDIARGRVYWSDSMYELLGMAAERPFLSFGEINALVHPHDGDLNHMAELLAASQTKTIDHTFRMRHAKGQWIWLRARAELVRESADEPARLVGIAVDTSEQKILAERSAVADMRLRDALEAVSEAFVLWDRNNRLVMCNSKFQRFHNLPDEAIVGGLAYRDVMAHATPPLVQSEIALDGRTETGARTYEAQLGDGRWLQINERRTKDGGYVSVGTDITALKKHEEQLLDSERRLMATVADLRKSRQTLEVQAQQLAELAERYLEQKSEAESSNRAKSEFLANMSHELRTPLNAIIGFSEMMVEQTFGALPPRYLSYCNDIKLSGQQLLGLISDVLEMSRLEAGRVSLEKTQVEIGAVIQAAIANVEEAAREKSIPIAREIAPGAALNADSQALQRVMTALLHNAVKFTPAGGRINIRTRRLHNALNIYVEDSGAGIAPEALARLGRPFEQWNAPLANGMKGSGLGLAITRSLVEMHGGTMRIRSTPGNGTIVMVHLPIEATLRPIKYNVAPPRRMPRANAALHSAARANALRTELQVSRRPL